MTFLDVITSPVFLWVVGILIVPGILLWIVSYFVASYCVYNSTLRRRSKKQWGREIPSDIEPLSKKMYEIGQVWSEENREYLKEVHIVNEGLNLYGEYYDFGYDKTVMVLSGRTESLRYGYYFAIPYAKNGCNVFVMDPRGHGLSDGEFNTVGFEESRDIVAWVRFLQEEFGVRSIIFHGICIGAAGGVFALTLRGCPDCVDGIVTEGMFPNFGESMKNHLIERKKPVLFLFGLIDGWMKHYTGHSMKFGPIDVIEKVNCPLLMLHSKEDIYSTPKYAQKLFDLAGASHKELVWFEKGRHSMLRITDTELYDSSISHFLDDVYSKTNDTKEKNYVL